MHAFKLKHPVPDLQPIGSVTEELMDARQRAHRVSTVLDDINRKYGNNSVYFGAMHQAIDRDAAPMRIPFASDKMYASVVERFTIRRYDGARATGTVLAGPTGSRAHADASAKWEVCNGTFHQSSRPVFW